MNCLAQGRKKKPFIDKKRAQTFSLVPRSQKDPLHDDPEEAQYVLKQVQVHAERGGEREKEKEEGERERVRWEGKKREGSKHVSKILDTSDHSVILLHTVHALYAERYSAVLINASLQYLFQMYFLTVSLSPSPPSFPIPVCLCMVMYSCTYCTCTL